MKRRFNFTGRKRIPRQNVLVGIHEDDSGDQYFEADLDLDGLHLPPTARVIMEAYHRTDRERYDFGSVARPTRPADTYLSSLARISNIRFAVKVVDRHDSRGRILASATGITPISEEEGGDERSRVSILPVSHEHDLGQLVWKVELDDASGPELWFNARIPSIEHASRNDPDVFCLVYPMVVREVLTFLAFVAGVTDVEDPEHEWKRNWLEFAQVVSGRQPPQVLAPHEQSAEFDQLEVREWIEDVVTGFSKRHSDRWESFIRGRR